MSHAYASTLDLSFQVRAGLLVRQTHHWAALVFVAAILLHLMRIFFTGAFRKPRELNYVIGLTLLTLAILEGFAGYSLPDDLASGMGLAIANAVALSIPVIGSHLALAIWGGPFPGTAAFESRLYILHVLILPAMIGGLIAIHLAMIALLKHTQFRGPGRRSETWSARRSGQRMHFAPAASSSRLPACWCCSAGWCRSTPLWQYGPYEVANGTNGVQPDWYMGWLIGALRLMPPIEPELFGRTIPNPFFGGALFPDDRCSGSCTPGHGSSGSSATTTTPTTCSRCRATTQRARRSAPRSSPGWRCRSSPARPTACSSPSTSPTRAR